MERSDENLAYWVKRFEYPQLVASVIGMTGMCLRVAAADDHMPHLAWQRTRRWSLARVAR